MIFRSLALTLSIALVVYHPPDRGRKAEERDHLRPGPAPGRYHGGELPSPLAIRERIQRCLGRPRTGRGMDRAQRRGQWLAVLPTGIVEIDAGLMRHSRL